MSELNVNIIFFSRFVQAFVFLNAKKNQGQCSMFSK